MEQKTIPLPPSPRKSAMGGFEASEALEELRKNIRLRDAPKTSAWAKALREGSVFPKGNLREDFADDIELPFALELRLMRAGWGSWPRMSAPDKEKFASVWIALGEEIPGILGARARADEDRGPWSETWEAWMRLGISPKDEEFASLWTPSGMNWKGHSGQMRFEALAMSAMNVAKNAEGYGAGAEKRSDILSAQELNSIARDWLDWALLQGLDVTGARTGNPNEGSMLTMAMALPAPRAMILALMSAGARAMHPNQGSIIELSAWRGSGPEMLSALLEGEKTRLEANRVEGEKLWVKELALWLSAGGQAIQPSGVKAFKKRAQEALKLFAKHSSLPEGEFARRVLDCGLIEEQEAKMGISHEIKKEVLRAEALRWEAGEIRQSLRSPKKKGPGAKAL